MENLHIAISVDDFRAPNQQGIAGKIEQAIADSLKASGCTFNYVRMGNFGLQPLPPKSPE